MAQVTDRNIGANPTGFDMRTELNNIIGALESDNSGSSEPLNTVAYMKWVDTSNATYYYVKERNHDNTEWVTLFRYTVATKIMEAVSNGVILRDSNIVHKTGDETIAGVKIFSDNVGIGVTPSAWGSNGYITANGVHSTNVQLLIGANSYYNLGYKYASTGIASQYEQNNGIHYWKTAPSGTAGSPITWTTAMTLGSNGNLLVGTTTDNGFDKLLVNGDIGTYGSQFNIWDNAATFETVNRGSSPRTFQWYVGANGGAPVASLTTSGVWTNASDKRNKVNIKDIHYGLDTIMSLSAKEYDLKSDGTHGIGFIAQEVKNIIPELVFGDEDKSYLTLDYASMVTVLTKAVQEQQAQIEELKLLIEGKQNGN